MKTKIRMTNYQLNIQRHFELQDFQTETVILSRLAFYLGFSYSNINLYVPFMYRYVTLLSFLSYLFPLIYRDEFANEELQIYHRALFNIYKICVLFGKEVTSFVPQLYNFYSLLCTLQTVYQSMSW